MSGTDTSRTALTRPFAGQSRRFQLRIGELGELERVCSAGIGEIMVRLAAHRFYHADIRETVRLGLEGGGMSEPEATALVMRYVDPAPLSEHIALAGRILNKAVSGVEMPEGNDDGEGNDASPATSPLSTDQGQPSGSTPEPSTA